MANPLDPVTGLSAYAESWQAFDPLVTLVILALLILHSLDLS